MQKGYGQAPDIIMQSQEVINSLIVKSRREGSAHQALHANTTDGTWSHRIGRYLGSQIFGIWEDGTNQILIIRDSRSISVTGRQHFLVCVSFFILLCFIYRLSYFWVHFNISRGYLWLGFNFTLISFDFIGSLSCFLEIFYIP